MAQDDPPPPPAPVDLRGFDAFVVGLRDRGMLPRLVGDLPEAAPPARPVQRRKPHGVE
jgi:hypothetical protein